MKDREGFLELLTLLNNMQDILNYSVENVDNEIYQVAQLFEINNATMRKSAINGGDCMEMSNNDKFIHFPSQLVSIHLKEELKQLHSSCVLKRPSIVNNLENFVFLHIKPNYR